jgi:hypothetical protein
VLLLFFNCVEPTRNCVFVRSQQNTGKLTQFKLFNRKEAVVKYGKELPTQLNWCWQQGLLGTTPTTHQKQPRTLRSLTGFANKAWLGP